MSSPDGSAPTLSIGQVAARTGLSVHALRFYEREGILAGPIRREGGGRRRYTEGDVEWLRLCTVLRASGMPIPEIRRYTELARTGTGTEPDRLALLRAHEQRVLDRLAELHRSLDIVRHKVAVYEDHLDGAAD
ncbi:DNA-binding transcriptional MerR regulator [Kitasatospora sp. SolWspMP-SS2h]|uniref:MerR family transcriptional regulator n=1 Tax=Kitasatospora sp. SolWspMP-SS2h TaxID=1305729 RepID=UPI000DB93BDE|nr:MerR family transcriptional regulator [Kitasatospora sp. SolWspMP-SS2h]RAJ35796.1 DNA-binding transcriptional MerR regulator [Kitasatospora sp. SolWspMP-SS2h]